MSECPRTSHGTVDPIVVQCWLGCLHFLQGHSLLYEVLDPPANDCHHVTILHHVVSVADVPALRDHIGAAFFVCFAIQELNDLVERIDMNKATDAARELAKRSIRARRQKWGTDGFRERMREWGKLGGRPRKEGRPSQ